MTTVKKFKTVLAQLVSIILAESPELKFTIMEIGALQIEGNPEPFYPLLDLFPGSHIIGFEVDEDLCNQMNAKAKAGVRYYPNALGEKNERRDFYITNHPMCCSLYEPNQALISLYNNFEVAYLKRKGVIDTVSMDYFARENGVSEIDFIKIDIQGAELDVFKGGVEALKSVLALVCEVEFISHYVEQPLFGDVCTFLDQHQLMFHKFLGLAGRALKPIVINNDPNLPSQHIWSDAVFVRHIQAIQNLSAQQLLKLSVLAAVYGSPDLSYYCLAHYDMKNGTTLAPDFVENAAR
jgi:FkbM family methyltransferase